MISSATITVIILLAVCTAIYFLRHILAGLVGLYRIVPANEAHIRILQNKKEIFSSRTGRSAYWYIPFITKLHKLPLQNLAIPVEDVKLNDKNMAKFVCDIMCFVNIKDLNLAAERLILTSLHHELGFDFNSLKEDLRAIMESIGRTMAAKQEILEIYRDRAQLDAIITREVQDVFPKWGIELVDLEIKDIKDAPNSNIIKDIERKVAADIERDAEIQTSNAKREAEITKAKNEEAYMRQQVTRDQNVGIAKQEAQMVVAQKEAEANVRLVEAQRKLDVGKAEIQKDIVEQQALAIKVKEQVEAQGMAAAVTLEGQAQAAVILAKLAAEAEGQEKLASALKKYDEAALNVKRLDIGLEAVRAKAGALSEVGRNAEINWILSGENAQKLFGVDLTAEGGAQFEQWVKAAGLDLDKLKAIVAAAKSKEK